MSNMSKFEEIRHGFGISVIIFVVFALIVTFAHQLLQSQNPPTPPINNLTCVAGSSSNDFPLKKKWCIELLQPVSEPPKIRDGIAYVQTQGDDSGTTFYAIDIDTSKILWRYEAMGSDRQFWEVVDNYVIIANSSGKIVSLARLNGQRVWDNTIRYLATESLVTDGKQLYIIAQGHAYAIDPKTGSMVWGRDEDFPSHSSFLAFYDEAHSTIVVPANHYYVISTKTGEPIYQSSSQAVNQFDQAISYEGMLIYADRIADAANDQTLYEMPDGYKHSFAPTVISNTLYYQTTNSRIKALDLKSKMNSWTYAAWDVPPLVHEFFTDFVAFDNYGFIITDDDILRAVALSNGNEVGDWTGPSSSRTIRGISISYEPPLNLVAGNNVLLASYGTNLLYAFEPK